MKKKESLKIKTNKLFAAITLGAGLCSTPGAHAALNLNLGGNGVYDTDLNVTWLRDANLAATNTFGVSGIDIDGRMNWNTAQSWIGAMNAANYLGYSDWRLPTTVDIGNNGYSGNSYDGTGDWGYNVSSSEMGHLYYTELGNLGYCSTAGACGQSGWGLTNTGLFINAQSYYYWSGTEYAPSTNFAWYFGAGNGYQDVFTKNNFGMHAWAVRTGQVAPVPEPEIYAMLLAGLGLVGFKSRRRRSA